MKKRSGPTASRWAEKSRAGDHRNLKDPSPRDRADAKAAPPGGAMREVVESIVVAFVLAFLFRTFEAEAFVIPTGSMAPTLMGRHKDVECDECGYPYRVSASDEMDNVTNQPKDDRVVSTTCPMCRYTMYIGPHNAQDKYYPSYKGDRILVGKFPYELRDPQRWEVAVFRYPGGAKTNYIKRIVGLPHETIRISHGDIFTRPAGRDEFTIQRKPACKLEAMLQPVYDNDYALASLVKLGWPPRWRAGPPQQAGRPGQWTSDDGKRFRTDGSSADEVWLGYRHVLPTYDDWQWLAKGVMPPRHSAPQPQLITDFAAYNTHVVQSRYATVGRRVPPQAEPDPNAMGLHWVGDLAIRAEVKVESKTGQVVFELVKGGRRFHCRLDVATGMAELSIPGYAEFGRPKAQTSVRASDSHKVMLANVDQQMRLWVDGQEIRFDASTTYGALGNGLPTDEDLEPARIGSMQAAVEIDHLEILRDIYYIAVDARSMLGSYGEPMSDYDRFSFHGMSADQIARLFSDPAQWQYFASARSVEFELGDGQFLMLGDNSAESKDSRLWPADGFEHYVRRDLMIGKALVIYWPHGWDVPGTDLPIKVIPNFGRIFSLVR